METKHRSLFVHALIYGLILGAIFIGVSLIYYILDLNLFKLGTLLLTQVINLVLVIVFIMIANNTYRDRYLGGKITFSQCFVTGLIVGLVGFIISTAYSYFFLTVIEPGYMEEGMNRMVETWGNSMSEERLDDMLRRMEKRMTPGSQIKSSLIYGAVISVILGLLIALFVKKDKTTTEA